MYSVSLSSSWRDRTNQIASLLRLVIFFWSSTPSGSSPSFSTNSSGAPSSAAFIPGENPNFFARLLPADPRDLFFGATCEHDGDVPHGLALPYGDGHFPPLRRKPVQINQ